MIDNNDKYAVQIFLRFYNNNVEMENVRNKTFSNRLDPDTNF